jgi:transposase
MLISAGDRLVSMLDHKLEPKTVRRVEVITGPGGRRRFGDDEKVRIIEEAVVPGAVISAVARQNGLAPQQLFTWLRQARRRTEAGRAEPAVFVPAVVESALPAKPVRRRRSRKRSRVSVRDTGMIEVEAGGLTVRIARGADVKVVAAVMTALKAAR